MQMRSVLKGIRAEQMYDSRPIILNQYSCRNILVGLTIILDCLFTSTNFTYKTRVFSWWNCIVFARDIVLNVLVIPQTLAQIRIPADSHQTDLSSSATQVSLSTPLAEVVT